MATNLVSNDLLEMRIVCATADQVSVNVLHYQARQVTGTVTDQEAADHVEQGVDLLYQSLLSVHATYRGVSAQRIFPLPKTVPAVAQNPLVGTHVGDLLPKQVSAVVTKQTRFAGRKYRGRIYIPFPSESANDTDSTPTAAYLATVEQLAAFLLQPIPVAGAGGGGATLTPILLHRDPVAPTFDDITTWRVNDKWGNQRRRGAYGQQNPIPF